MAYNTKHIIDTFIIMIGTDLFYFKENYFNYFK